MADHAAVLAQSTNNEAQMHDIKPVPPIVPVRTKRYVVRLESPAAAETPWKMAQYAHMHMTSPLQLPESLTAIFDRFANSYSSAGTRFSDFPGRWLAFQATDLERGMERPLLDIEPPQADVLEAKDKFDSDAMLAAGAGVEVIIVSMYLAQQSMIVRRAGESCETGSANPMLSISVSSSEQSLGVSGYVELDSHGVPVRVGQLLPLFSLSKDTF
jgi:hypothetical protein